MALTPRLQGVDHGTQALADLRQAVFDARWHFGIDLADHQRVVLERAQLLGQHPLGAILQVVENDALPFAVDQVERRLDRAAWPVGKIPPFHGVFSNSIQTGTISPNIQYLPKWRENDK